MLLINRLNSLFLMLICAYMLSACQPGTTPIVTFPEASSELKTDSCDDIANGYWVFNSAAGKKTLITSFAEKLIEHGHKLYARFKIDSSCISSTLLLAVQRSKTTTKTGYIIADIDFLKQGNGSYFAIKMGKSTQYQTIILKITMQNQNTLAVSFMDKQSIVTAINNKHLAGKISKFNLPIPSPTAQQLNQYIKKYSDKLFTSTLVFKRQQDQVWNMSKIRCCR